MNVPQKEKKKRKSPIKDWRKAKEKEKLIVNEPYENKCGSKHNYFIIIFNHNMKLLLISYDN